MPAGRFKLISPQLSVTSKRYDLTQRTAKPVYHTYWIIESVTRHTTVHLKSAVGHGAEADPAAFDLQIPAKDSSDLHFRVGGWGRTDKNLKG
ncbi:hypothetical protein BaRGS_00029562 [Batillaria attramentaria]|uniref:Uncharacterized protein n=1 Tax=Batillaria attramentaria TaxID=370345 RepID=A0ABD0JXI0_9CAEN